MIKSVTEKDVDPKSDGRAEQEVALAVMGGGLV
jgi:hypothetical protein